MTTPFPRDAHLTTIARAYKNPDVTLIADEVFPRVPVGKRVFRHYEYPLEQGFQVPNTFVGERGTVRQVELKGTQVEKSCEDFGIDIPLTKSDIDDAPKGVNPREKATEAATNIVLLDREKRAAELAFTAGNWPLKIDLSGGGNEQWSAASPTKNPLKIISDGFDACAMRPNILALGQAVWSALRFHPLVLEAAFGATGGALTKERLAELLEIEKVIVGAGLVNNVKPGKTPSLVHVWGKHALGFYRDRQANTSGGITMGYTAEYGTRFAGSKPVDMGLAGGELVRAGETVKEVIVADRAAYFFQNAVA